jgi:spermidine synthase
MKKWTQLDETTLPDGTKLGLWEHDGAYSLRLAGKELMSTRQYASEQQLAQICCGKLGSVKAPRVLIGGLGFGFTLRAALDVLPRDAVVEVAELLPDVVRWNRDKRYPLAHEALEDPRTDVIEADVADVINQPRGQRYDAILLDVDNGAGAFTQDRNKHLYREVNLTQILSILTNNGVVGFWSAQEDPRFAKRLSRAGFRVETQQARAHTSGGNQHTLIFGYVR